MKKVNPLALTRGWDDFGNILRS